MPHSLTERYTGIPSKAGGIHWRPYLTVTLHANNKAFKISALVDSGADTCFFSYEAAERLGLNVTTGRRGKVAGIGGEHFTTYYHEIELEIDSLTGSRRKTIVGFSDAPFIDVLGQEGFFEFYKIAFNLKHLNFMIEEST